MPKSRTTTPYRVQVAVGADQEYFREIVLGVRHYGFETGRLAFADRWLPHESRDLARLVKRDGVQGIVAALHTPEAERRFAALGVPVVNVSNSMRVPRLPVVTQDDVAVGRLAAAHLRECGCRAFGYWGQTGRSYSEQRWVGFREGLDEAKVWRAGSVTGERPERMFARMRAWLAELPRPAGVFAAMDSYALVLLRAARESGWRVPEDVAVLGAGDDDFFVEMEDVPLSSIRLPSREIGYNAASLLDRMISKGRAAQAESIHLPTATLRQRRSTDVALLDDEAVAKAVRIIRDRPGVRVAELARAAGLSRTGLQARFKRALGRGMLEEIMRVRLGVARDLLEHGNAKLEAVAERAGFASVQRLSAQFVKATGDAPGRYRLRMRRG